MSAPLVFITGASSGIGQALAARFHQAGYRLALVARRSTELSAWASHLGGEPARYAVYTADVRDIDSFQFSDFTIEGYDPHPKIAMDMAV